MKTKENDLLYELQHKICPTILFNDPKRVLSNYKKELDFHYVFLKRFFEEVGLPMNYKESDFSAEWYEFGNMVVIRQNFPEPEENALCYCAYLLCDGKKTAYFTVEKADANDPFNDLLARMLPKEEQKAFKQPFLCYWDKNRNHYNCGHCSLDKEENMKQCLDLFSRM